MKLIIKGNHNIPNETLFGIIKANSSSGTGPIVIQKTYSEFLLDLVAENRLDYDKLEEVACTKLDKWFSDLVRQNLVRLLNMANIEIDLRHDAGTESDEMYVATRLNEFDPSLAPNIYQAIRSVLLVTFPERIVNINHPDTYDKFIAKYVLSNKCSYDEARKRAETVVAESIHELVKCVIHNLINGTDLNKRPLVYVYSKRETSSSETKGHKQK